MLEIHYHTVGIELPGAAEYRDDGVVSVKFRALALIIEGKFVCESYFYAFGYVVHAVRLNFSLQTYKFFADRQ